MTNGGPTFRQCIDVNKKRIMEYLLENGDSFSRDICDKYTGEREMSAVRKALNELRKEEKITTDDKVHFWQGKFWKLTK